MRVFLASLLLVLFGCAPKSPSKEWSGIARILPIIVTNADGETRWTKEKIESGFKDTNEYWSDIGIQFKMVEPETVVSDKMYDQDGWMEFLSVTSTSKNIANERHVYPVYFVDSIKWGEKTYAGMSTSADAPFGYQYGTMVSATVRNRSGRTIAHELGHAWNLRHTWSDKHDDTPNENSSDCNTTIQCNVMSYCFGRLNCQPPPFFSPEQIIEARRWALSQGRLHVLETDAVVQQSVLPLQTEFTPILDPVNDWDKYN